MFFFYTHWHSRSQLIECTADNNASELKKKKERNKLLCHAIGVSMTIFLFWAICFVILTIYSLNRRLSHNRKSRRRRRRKMKERERLKKREKKNEIHLTDHLVIGMAMMVQIFFLHIYILVVWLVEMNKFFVCKFNRDKTSAKQNAIAWYLRLQTLNPLIFIVIWIWFYGWMESVVGHRWSWAYFLTQSTQLRIYFGWFCCVKTLLRDLYSQLCIRMERWTRPDEIHFSFMLLGDLSNHLFNEYSAACSIFRYQRNHLSHPSKSQRCGHFGTEKWFSREFAAIQRTEFCDMLSLVECVTPIAVSAVAMAICI